MAEAHCAAGPLDEKQCRRLADTLLHGFQAHEFPVEFVEDFGDAGGLVFLGEVDRSRQALGGRWSIRHQHCRSSYRCVSHI